MTAFVDRFKRVPGPAKRYIDLETGEEISYRQARNRAERDNLTRKSHSSERKERAQAGVRAFYKDQDDYLKLPGNKKLTRADLAPGGKGWPKWNQYYLKLKNRRIEAYSENLQGFKTVAQAAKAYERTRTLLGSKFIPSTGRVPTRRQQAAREALIMLPH